MAAPHDCSVCCEPTNKTTRKPVTCGFCSYVSCFTCTKSYLLTSTQDPHCMSCRKVWNREFMDTVFAKSFMSNEYKRHREIVLIDRERSLLPATMPYAEDCKRAKKYHEELGVVRKDLFKLSRWAVTATPPSTVEGCDKEEEKEIQIATLKARSRYLKRRIDILEKPELFGAAKPAEETRKFTRACPAIGCRGFLSTQWKCGLCEIWACPDCHDIIGQDKKTANHVCKPEDLESARLIAKDSRPCPGCASLIFKIDGCDQMYCVQCHTAFSWRTGKVETGVIHNPHYYEIMRKRNGGVIPRNQGDQECGGMPAAYELSRHVREVTQDQSTVTYFSEALRLFNHIERVELQQGFRPPDITNNRDLRVKFLINEIDEDKFKRLLQCKERKHDKIREGRFVLTMFNTALGDMLRRANIAGTKEGVKEVRKEISELVGYTNKCFEALGDRYNCLAPMVIESSWRFSNVGW